MTNKKPTAIELITRLVETLEESKVPPPPPKQLIRARKPRGTNAPVKKVIEPRPKKFAYDPAWDTVEKICPKCGEQKNVVAGFGLVKSKKTGRIDPVGWCKKCRNEDAYLKSLNTSRPR